MAQNAITPLNPWVSDPTDSSYVARVTDIDDAAVVYLQIVDPNDATKGIPMVITGADLKAACRNVQKPVAAFTAAALTLDGTEQDVVTLTVTPVATDVVIHLAFNATFAGDRNAGGVENAHTDIKVYRGTTEIRAERYEFSTHVSSQTQRQQSVVFLIDSPNTTQATTYKVTATRGSSLENASVFNRSLVLTEYV